MPARSGVAVAAYPSRTRQRLETRDRVFDAALKEFHRVGVAAAEIEHIVRAAGVARGTFYLHFPTKDHVLMELLRRKQAVLAAEMRTLRAASSRTFLRRVVDLMAEDAMGEDRALWHELIAVIARHAPEMQSQASALVEALTGLFAAAQKRGEVRRDVTPFDLAAVFLPGAYGLLQMRLDDTPSEVRTALHRVVDIFVRGIALDPAGGWK
jgi:TetR/AcrR family transcriptional regulator, repressor for uid operon